jgi:hypothetical protein
VDADEVPAIEQADDAGDSAEGEGDGND